MNDQPQHAGHPDVSPLIRRHLRFGWWALFVFLVLGLGLEGLNGFKVDWYLAVSNEARRHTINIAFALVVPHLTAGSEQRFRWISGCLLAATVLLPAGFLVGGLFIHAGDPGLGIVLVPLGALVMGVAALLVARSV